MFLLRSSLLILAAAAALFIFFPSSAHAAQNLTIGSSDRFLNSIVEPTGLEKNDVATTSGIIIKGLLRVVGLAFLILMVYGG